VTVKLLLPLSDPGWALTAPLESTIVSSSSGNEEMSPLAEPDVTFAPLVFQEWKSDSGYTPLEPLGASAIHSALLSAQLEQVRVVLKRCWRIHSVPGHGGGHGGILAL
jgi:hypothetical protein